MKERNALLIEPQDDFLCFILPSLQVKYEFKYIEIGLLRLNSIKTYD